MTTKDAGLLGVIVLGILGIIAAIAPTVLGWLKDSVELEATQTAVAEMRLTIVVTPTAALIDHNPTNTSVVTFTPTFSPTAVPPPQLDNDSDNEIQKIYEVSSRDEDGLDYICSVSADHKITIVGGAYNPWGEGDSEWWRTVLYVFVNTPIEWDAKKEPTSQYQVGHYQSIAGNSQPDAEKAGQGQSVTVHCEAGEILRLITVDTQDSYDFDNTGEVKVTIEAQPN